MEGIENFEEKIVEIEKLRNNNRFSDSLLRDTEIKQESYELALLMNEDYEGQIFEDPIQAGFALLPIHLQIQMSRAVYEGAKTGFDLNDFDECLKRHMVAWEMRIETLKFAKNDPYRILDVAYSAFEVVRVNAHLFGGAGPPDLMREAEKAIRKAIRASKNNPFHLGKMYHNLGFVLHADKRIDQAITAYEKALEFQKKSGDKRGYALTRARRGKCYLDMAREDYEKAFQGFYDEKNKSRVSEQRKPLRDFGKFFETLFRKREEVSYDNGGWEIKPAKVPDSEIVDYRPHTGVIVVTSYLVGDMEAADEHLFDKGIPEVLFSLLPYKFLDEQREKYIELAEYLDLYKGCNYQAREEMKVGRISWWIGNISDTDHLAGVQLGDFKTKENRKEFVRKTLRHLYQALYQSFVLARMSETIMEPASLRKISQLWIDYMLESSFLDDLERLALDVVERFGFEPETKEDRYAFTTEAVKKIFDLKDTQVADGFPEIVARQGKRKTRQK